VNVTDRRDFGELIWRRGLSAGESQYGPERRLSGFPDITMPTITLEGDAKGAPHPVTSAGKYEYRLIGGGIGHNLP
jgi:hypothetical protein